MESKEATNTSILFIKNDALKASLMYPKDIRYLILATYIYIQHCRMQFGSEHFISLIRLYATLGRQKNYASLNLIKHVIDILSHVSMFNIKLVEPICTDNLTLNGYAIFESEPIENSFFKISDDEFQKLYSTKYKNKPHLIFTYCVIVSHIFERRWGDSNETRPEAWSASYIELSDQTGLSVPTLVNIVKELQELKLICCKVPDTERLGKDYFIRIPTIYARYGHNEELEYKYNQLASKFYKGCKKKSYKKKNVQNASVTPGQSDGNSDDDWDDAWGTEAATDEWDDGYLE